MCGRFALGAWADASFQAAYPYMPIDQWVNEEAFHPRHNIAPRSQAPVIRRNPDNKNALQMQTMRWGVVPHWSKHDDSKLNTINAKGENLVEGSAGMWASLKGKKRCVVPVQGYYEWLKQGSGRFPHFTKHKDGRIMLLAGMWDSVTFEDAKEPLYTFTIVTTSANTQVSWLHDRMPVILSEQKEIETWLNSELGWTAEVAKCVRPYPGELETYAVSKEVGKVGNEDSKFIEPISERKDGIAAMFRSQDAKAKGTPTPASSPSKKRAAPKEEDGDDDVKSPPPSPSKKARKTPTSPSKARMKKAEEDAAGNGKITEFFGRTTRSMDNKTES